MNKLDDKVTYFVVATEAIPCNSESYDSVVVLHSFEDEVVAAASPNPKWAPYHGAYEEGNEYLLGLYADSDRIRGDVSHDNTTEYILLPSAIKEMLG